MLLYDKMADKIEYVKGLQKIKDEKDELMREFDLYVDSKYEDDFKQGVEDAYKKNHPRDYCYYSSLNNRAYTAGEKYYAYNKGYHFAQEQIESRNKRTNEFNKFKPDLELSFPPEKTGINAYTERALFQPYNVENPDDLQVVKTGAGVWKDIKNWMHKQAYKVLRHHPAFGWLPENPTGSAFRPDRLS